MASSLNTAAREAADRFATAFEVPARTEPFRHFILDRLLPEPILDAVAAHRIDRPVAGDTGGRRETENSLRRFVTPTLRTADPAFAALAAALQHESVVTILAERCRAALDGTKLRIEYCADGAGFWLEPHTDIAAKRLTLLIYLNSPPRGEDWGTDLYNGDLSLAGTAPSHANAGLAFVPAQDTWHGFRRRKITGVRRTLIVNYVAPDWRSAHELAYPDQPVRAVCRR